MDGDSFTLELAPSIADIPAAEWDTIAGTSNPFVSHAFLRALEVGGATGGDSGWHRGSGSAIFDDLHGGQQIERPLDQHHGKIFENCQCAVLIDGQ